MKSMGKETEQVNLSIYPLVSKNIAHFYIYPSFYNKMVFQTYHYLILGIPIFPNIYVQFKRMMYYE